MKGINIALPGWPFLHETIGATPLFLDTVSKNLVLDISKIKNELNYSPSMNLGLSLPDIYSWVKAIGGTEVLKEADRRLAWIP